MQAFNIFKSNQKRFKNLLTVGVLAVLVAMPLGCGMGTKSASQYSGKDEVPTGFMRWNDLPVKYKIASTVPEEYHAEIQAAFNEWNTATGREVFKFAGMKNLKNEQLAPEFTVSENVVLVTERSGEGPDVSNAAIGSGPLARTMLYGLSSIKDADIYLFEFSANFVEGRPGTGDVYSIRSVVLHEAGHMLFGPYHSDDPESIMTSHLYPQDHPMEKLGLAKSDLDIFHSIYGE